MAVRDAEALVLESLNQLKPPPKLSTSEWADKYFEVSKGGSTGKWETRPYQREILDCWTDPLVWRTSIMKSARVGATTMLNISECYHLHWDPCDSCTVQPTTGYAEKYSRDTFNKIIENVSVIGELFKKSSYRDGTNSILEKYVNGASLSFLGANSPNGFRGWTYRVARADEVDGYVSSGAGNEGDQIELLLNRTIDYHNRVFIDASTPTIEGFSRIEASYKQGDQRQRFVPCPHCGHMQFFKANAFTPGSKKDEPGGFWWEPGKPSTVVYICESCDQPILHSQKFDMDRNGEWRPTAPANIAPDGREHRSYFIWAALSYQANASWAHIVEAYEKTHESPQQLQVFINTWLGQTFKEDAATRVTAEGLMAKRDTYKLGTVPEGVLLITIGVDMQDDRAEISVWGWGRSQVTAGLDSEAEGWLIQHSVIHQPYNSSEVYAQIDTFVNTEFELPCGAKIKPEVTAIDSGDGDHTPYVYDYARQRRLQGVIPIKGMSTNGKPPIGKGSASEYTMKNRPKKSSVEMFQVGTDVIKTRLMARLRQERASGPGALHFPAETTEEYFVQLVSERRHSYVQAGQPKFRWVRRPGVRAETLDCAVYAYAALHHAYKKYNMRTIWDQLEARLKAPEKPAEQAQPAGFNLLK
jgi:phage terminase large subunit GpA-like protein